VSCGGDLRRFGIESTSPNPSIRFLTPPITPTPGPAPEPPPGPAPELTSEPAPGRTPAPTAKPAPEQAPKPNANANDELSSDSHQLHPDQEKIYTTLLQRLMKEDAEQDKPKDTDADGNASAA